MSYDANAAGELDVAATLNGKNIGFIGSTGFVGKVALSMLLYRYPNVGKLFAVVRPGAGNTPEQRFFKTVAASPAFDPLRERWGDGFESFLREKVVPISGDIGRPLCNFTDADFAAFEAAGGLDVLVNSAGLVNFTPSLESALRINAQGAQNCLDAARRAKAALVHVSTCFVCGRREGEVWEDEPVVGYFPRHRELRDDDFDVAAEIADCQRVIDQQRDLANDRRHISEFRERAARTLEAQRRDPDDQAALKLAVARERKLWLNDALTKIGMQRAEHWGWTNTYTYTKSLGEQIILRDKEVRSTIVRPAVVESSFRYPFPGWNEGFNTTAPLIYLIYKGARQIAVSDVNLDVIPVDMVASGMIMATAAILANQHESVYALGTSGSNPVTAKRLCELSALVVRKHRRELADQGVDEVENRLRARMEAFAVSHEQFNRTSAPQFKRVAEWLSEQIDEKLPRWGAPRVTAMAERAKEELARVSDFTGRVTELMELFRPFAYDHHIIFRTDHTDRLWARLAPHDRQGLYWEPRAIDWRRYWFETHFPGLMEWVFPVLDDEFGTKPRSVYTYKDLLELFDSAAKLHRHRVAMRLLPAGDKSGEPVVYTYERVQDMAQQAAGVLRQRGVAIGDRVMLMSENRPEWGISYFGILKAGATVVPVDSQISLAEVENLLAASSARVLIASSDVARRLCEDGLLGMELARRGRDVAVLDFDDLLTEPAVSPAAVHPPRRGDAVASLIYTSGTTGAPKGVMLTHKNFTSMAAKLSSLFHLYRHDGLLSVLPLHHTFEFSAGLLMPLVHGSHINYLEKVDAEALADAFDSREITGMVGVPALWQLLHRKIFKRAADKGPLVQRAFETVIELNRQLSERLPYGVNVGKLLFYPVHRAMGGRLRLMISGGSALSPEVMKSFQGLGFRLFEGYGMTEASPVITAQRPGETPIPGSVGRALPGVDVKIFEADSGGVGEVVAKGPNVMVGYFQNEDATGQVLRDGWLHTGDLGRLDDKGNLYIVGRKKEMILGASGENVYPDELEDIYRDSPYVKEISVVGLPADTGETVAALVVPEYEQDGAAREEVRERVREHMRAVSAKLPMYKRVKVFHLWDHDLPKTSTRKVKRREVLEELSRLERAAKGAAAAAKAAPSSAAIGATGGTWVRDVIAQVSQKPRAKIEAATRMDELGFDSLMITELGVALEAAGVTLPDPAQLAGIETVADLETFVERHGMRAAKRAADSDADGASGADEIHVPGPLVRLGRDTLRFGQRMLYERFLDADIRGKAYVPPFGGYIVAANHCSHLDMGLVKHALGESGPALVALAAKDYFFEDPVRRMYFENFTNLVPMERHGSLRESLRLAGEVLREGYILLIFPEGTRSETGVMIDFKPSLGYLAMSNRCGILPMYLAGTYDAMPKGAYLPKPRREVSAHVGPFLDYAELAKMSAGLTRSESYRRIAMRVERTVRRLAPAEYEWTLGEAGRTPLAEQRDGSEPAAGADAVAKSEAS